jgi:hypothetical protein
MFFLQVLARVLLGEEGLVLLAGQVRLLLRGTVAGIGICRGALLGTD